MESHNSVVEIKGSPAKLTGLLFLGVIMTALSGMIVWGTIPVRAGSLGQFMGWAGLLFFGLCTLVIGSRLMTSSKTIVTLSPSGYLDTRLSERPIPWAAIQNVMVWTMQGQKVIVLQVPPETEASVGLTRIARWSRGANAKLGADGLCTVAAGLKTKHDDLLSAIMERVDAARAASQANIFTVSGDIGHR